MWTRRGKSKPNTPGGESPAPPVSPVDAWLTKLSLQELIPTFRTQKVVDLLTVYELDDHDLILMGIQFIGDRKRILRATRKSVPASPCLTQKSSPHKPPASPCLTQKSSRQSSPHQSQRLPTTEINVCHSVHDTGLLIWMPHPTNKKHARVCEERNPRPPLHETATRLHAFTEYLHNFLKTSPLQRSAPKYTYKGDRTTELLEYTRTKNPHYMCSRRLPEWFQSNKVLQVPASHSLTHPSHSLT